MMMNRRGFMCSALAGIAVAGSGRVFPASGAFPMDSLEAHVKMRCNLAGGRTYWYYQGTVFGNLFGNATQPMLGVEGISYSQLEKLPGGRYRYAMTEAGYYADPTTGQVTGKVRNPFTGESYEPEHFLSSQTNIFDPDLTVVPDIPNLPPGLEYRGRIAPVRSFQGKVWSAEDLFVRTPVAPEVDGPEFKVQTSLATFTAERSEMLDPDETFAACQMNYQTIGTWRDWMGMGNQPGMISWRMIGTKCHYADLPRPLVDRIASDHQTFFDV